jgi:hypothetical protein
MSTRWEYATMSYTYAVRPREGTTEAEGRWAYKEDIYVWLPGAEKAVHHPVRDTEDETVSGPNRLDVLNELGAEGWELVDRESTGSAAGKTAYGWSEGSWPITIVWTLKRPVTWTG